MFQKSFQIPFNSFNSGTFKVPLVKRMATPVSLTLLRLRFARSLR